MNNIPRISCTFGGQLWTSSYCCIAKRTKSGNQQIKNTPTTMIKVLVAFSSRIANRLRLVVVYDRGRISSPSSDDGGVLYVFVIIFFCCFIAI